MDSELTCEAPHTHLPYMHGKQKSRAKNELCGGARGHERLQKSSRVALSLLGKKPLGEKKSQKDAQKDKQKRLKV